MDRQTYRHISERIRKLELCLDHISDKGTVNQQIRGLQSQLNTIYKEHDELVTLNRIIGEHGIWNKIENDTEGEEIEVESKQKDTDSNKESAPGVSISCPKDQIEITQDMKRQVVLLKYNSIKEAYENVMRLESLDVDRLVNYIESSQDKVYNFNEIQKNILARQEQLKEIADKFHMLVLKNMIVFEKYLNLINGENSFWLESHEQLRQLSVRIGQQERKVGKKY